MFSACCTLHMADPHHRVLSLTRCLDIVANKFLDQPPNNSSNACYDASFSHREHKCVFQVSLYSSDWCIGPCKQLSLGHNWVTVPELGHWIVSWCKVLKSSDDLCAIDHVHLFRLRFGVWWHHHKTVLGLAVHVQLYAMHINGASFEGSLTSPYA